MGRHGENIRKRSDGRWEARYLVYDETRNKKICRSVYGYTYEEVKAKRVAIIMESAKQPDKRNASEKKTDMSQEVLFGTAAEEWLASIKSEQKPSTYEKYNFIYHCYLETVLEKSVLCQITEEFVREKLSYQNTSDSLKKSIYCVLNGILKYASKKYQTTLSGIPKTPSIRYGKAAEAFNKTEQAELLSALYYKSDRYKLAVLLCLFTGLRLGELCALRWTDIDFENKTLAIKRTVQRLYVEGHNGKTVLVETTPKSAHSKREIPLQDIVISFLINFQNGKEYVFGGDKPLDPRTMQNHYKKIMEEAGISYKNFHVLRHTYATNCIEGGADIKSLSEMLGHSNVKITLNYYVHPSMDIKRMYADNLYEFYVRINGQVQGSTR